MVCAMRYALAALLLTLLAGSALAGPPAKVEQESLMGLPMDGKIDLRAGGKPLDPKVLEKKLAEDSKATGEAAEALSPENQAAMICQTADIMKGQIGPNYQAGVDAYGNPVVPADGGMEQAFQLPDQIDIPIDVAVMQALGVVTNPPTDLKARVGTLTVLKNGKLSYNGKDITNDIEGYCRKHLKDMEKMK